MGGLISLVIIVVGVYFIYRRIKYCRGVKVNFPPGLQDFRTNKKEESVSEPVEPKPGSVDKIETSMFQSGENIEMQSRRTGETISDSRYVKLE